MTAKDPENVQDQTAIGLSVRHLQLGWDGTTLIENLTFDAPQGAWTCLLGESGVGKSTLLRTIAGLIEPLCDTQIVGSPGDSLVGKTPSLAQKDGPPPRPTPWLATERIGRLGTPPSPGQSPRVLDLSSLWAGPLCAQLLGASGARVIKAESVHRPDGARRGDPRFFDLLNAGKLSVALELGQPSGITALRALTAQADNVAASARPRALARVGIDPRAYLAPPLGQVWVSITGHGRSGADGGWAGSGARPVS